jgi:hypothetical protein
MDFYNFYNITKWVINFWYNNKNMPEPGKDQMSFDKLIAPREPTPPTHEGPSPFLGITRPVWKPVLINGIKKPNVPVRVWFSHPKDRPGDFIEIYGSILFTFWGNKLKFNNSTYWQGKPEEAFANRKTGEIEDDLVDIYKKTGFLYVESSEVKLVDNKDEVEKALS